MDNSLVITPKNEAQRQLQAAFLAECNSKRLTAIVGKGNEAKFMSDFLTIASEFQGKPLPQVIRCCIDIASMKLPILKQAGQAYIVPRAGQLNVEIGYKGWLVLAKRAGFAVKTIPVFEGDAFSLENDGFEDKMNYKACEDTLRDQDASKLRGICVCVRDLTLSIDTIRYLPLSTLQKLKSFSQTKNGDSPAYRDWLLEMYQAKAIKYVLRKLPIDTMHSEIFNAFAEDDKNDVGMVKEAPKVEASNPFASARVDAEAGEVFESEVAE